MHSDAPTGEDHAARSATDPAMRAATAPKVPPRRAASATSRWQRQARVAMAKRALTYGALLAIGTLALQWIDYQRLARAYSGDIFTFLIAAGFLALGVIIGMRVIGAGAPAAFDGNPRALAALGISARELAVLQQVAAGRSNKEIAAQLNVSPNTVKTHLANLFEKLGARRRTEAINKARALGIVP